MQANLKITPADVQKLVEEHLDKSLAENKQSRVTNLYADMCGTPEPGQANLALNVTFEILDRR